MDRSHWYDEHTIDDGDVTEHGDYTMCGHCDSSWRVSRGEVEHHDEGCPVGEVLRLEAFIADVRQRIVAQIAERVACGSVSVRLVQYAVEQFAKTTKCISAPRCFTLREDWAEEYVRGFWRQNLGEVDRG